MNHQQKIEQFAASQMQKNMHNLVLPDDQGNHLAFGKYRISSENQVCGVYNNNEELVAKFSNRRTALSYCVADKFQRFNLALQIKSLDFKKQILSNDIASQRALADRSRNAAFREMVRTKLDQKIIQLKAVENELEKCVISAKYLQLKGFQNETARVFTN